MKKLLASAIGIFGVLLLAAPGNAANPPSGAPQQKSVPGAPGLQSVAQLSKFKLVSVTHAPLAQDGSFQLDVAIENLTATAQATTVAVLGSLAEPAQTLAPHATGHFVFRDAAGGPPTCGFVSSKEYTITVTDSAAHQDLHHAVMHAGGCTFAASATRTIQPWNLLKPDNVAAFTASSLYIQNVTIDAAQTCNGNAKVKVAIVNHSTTNQTFNVSARSTSTFTGSVKNVTVAKNGYTTVEMPMTSAIAANSPGTTLYIDGGANVEASNIQVVVQPTCSYSADLDPAAGAAPQVPR